MKKALAILMTLAFVASVATADVKIGAWGRGLFTPATGTGSEPTSVEGTSWGDSIRTGFTVAGSSDNVGFQVDMNADGFKPGIGDNALIWVKPFDGLTLKIGQIKEETLRGNGCFGSFDWIRISWTGEDLTFKRIETAKGLVATFTGVENLYIGAGLEASKTTVNMLKDGQYAIGYTFADVGQLRAQYIGAASQINAAFRLTGVENLYIDLGTYLNLTGDLNPTIAGYVNYKLDALALHLLAKADITTATALELGVGANYDLGNGIGILGDVRAADILNNGKIGFMLGATKGFSNGLVGIGFEMATKGGFAPGAYSNADATAASWAVPVRFEYWF